MFTTGQSDFLIHYIDPDSNTLRSYYPDFLIETQDGLFYIIEIKGGNRIDLPITKAKTEYATRFAKDSKMEYVFIPDNFAAMKLQEFIALQSKQNAFYSFDKKHGELYAAQSQNTDLQNEKPDKDARYKIKH